MKTQCHHWSIGDAALCECKPGHLTGLWMWCCTRIKSAECRLRVGRHTASITEKSSTPKRLQTFSFSRAVLYDSPSVGRAVIRLGAAEGWCWPSPHRLIVPLFPLLLDRQTQFRGRFFMVIHFFVPPCSSIFTESNGGMSHFRTLRCGAQGGSVAGLWPGLTSAELTESVSEHGSHSSPAAIWWTCISRGYAWGLVSLLFWPLLPGEEGGEKSAAGCNMDGPLIVLSPSQRPPSGRCVTEVRENSTYRLVYSFNCVVVFTKNGHPR